MSRLNQQQVPVEDGNDKDANLQGAGAGVAPRNNRDAWLRRSTPRRGVIVLLTIATAALIASVVVLVPFLKRHVHRSPVPMQHANLPKPQFNETHHDNIGLDAILNSHGYFEGFEKENAGQCELKPESRQELGQGTWSLLHIMAATYPAEPSPQTIQEHRLFFQLLPRIYPCPECRVHMREMFRQHPPQLNSQKEFSTWLCESHNRVNLRLGKPAFDCTTLDDRWDCGCNVIPGPPPGMKPPPSSSRHSPPSSSRHSRPERHRQSHARAERKGPNGPRKHHKAGGVESQGGYEKIAIHDDGQEANAPGNVQETAIPLQSTK